MVVGGRVAFLREGMVDEARRLLRVAEEHYTAEGRAATLARHTEEVLESVHLMGGAIEVDLDAIRCSQTQSDEIRCNQTQSAIRCNQML